MSSHDPQPEAVVEVARKMGIEIRKQARGRWANVRTAERNEGSRHVWRFQSGPDMVERFLHVPHEVMTEGKNPAAALMDQLKKAHWLDRLAEGSATSFVLSPTGRLRPWPKA
jgi:hypothetical protein